MGKRGMATSKANGKTATQDDYLGRVSNPLLLSEMRADIAQYYVQGYSIRAIAQELNTTIEKVSRELYRIERWWNDYAIETLETHKARELGKLNALEKEYWRAWERSCTNTIRRLVYDADANDYVVETVELTMVRDGDPRFLQGVGQCIRDRCTLLNLSEVSVKLTVEQPIQVIGGIDLAEDV